MNYSYRSFWSCVMISLWLAGVTAPVGAANVTWDGGGGGNLNIDFGGGGVFFNFASSQHCK